MFLRLLTTTLKPVRDVHQNNNIQILGVFFVNAARGSIVDENELIKNLKSGKIRAAALDVYENEPLSPENPLWEMENVIISPHNSWISEMRNERRFNLIYDNMIRYKKGEQLRNIVQLEKGY